MNMKKRYFENDIYQELGKGMPGIGERIETPEGLAVVMDVNILVDKIKCRLIQTETNAEGDEYEKLDNEILVYSKEEITRQDKRRGKGLQQAPKKQQPAKQKKKEEETEQEEAAPKESKNRERSSRNRPRRRREEGKEGRENKDQQPETREAKGADEAAQADRPRRKRRRHRGGRRKPQEGQAPKSGE